MPKFLILPPFEPTLIENLKVLDGYEVIQIIPTRTKFSDKKLSVKSYVMSQEKKLLEMFMGGKIKSNDVVLVGEHQIFDLKTIKEFLPCRFIADLAWTGKMNKKQLKGYETKSLMHYDTIPKQPLECPTVKYFDKVDKIAYIGELNPDYRKKYWEFLKELFPKYEFVEIDISKYSLDKMSVLNQLKDVKAFIEFNLKSEKTFEKLPILAEAMTMGCLPMVPRSFPYKYFLSRHTYSVQFVGGTPPRWGAKINPNKKKKTVDEMREFTRILNFVEDRMDNYNLYFFQFSEDAESVWKKFKGKKHKSFKKLICL